MVSPSAGKANRAAAHADLQISLEMRADGIRNATLPQTNLVTQTL
jgi:hypothetical protein